MIDILIVEDNPELGQLLRDFLIKAGYSVRLCTNGESATEYFAAYGAKLVLLDIILPGMDGFAVCKAIRAENHGGAENDPAILILSAKGDKEDKISGLNLGADDYIDKPYDIDILLAKIAGIFKRKYNTGIITLRDISIDKVKREARKSGVTVNLTAKEFDLLLLLAENPGKVLRKELIFNRIWGYDSFSEQQTLTVHINHLREKFEDHSSRHNQLIQTVWGVGYKLCDESTRPGKAQNEQNE
jgi:DNA-binding response OmpR family regulator